MTVRPERRIPARVTPLARMYIDACDAELQALKPGNVSIFGQGHGMCCVDFAESARLSAPMVVNFERPLGERIFRAVSATRDRVGCNTNLGILLLCAPLLQAAWTMRPGLRLRDALLDVLQATDVGDARWAYRAIRLAAPAGLGEAPAHDVSREPQVGLLKAMQAAAGRDRIAYQYSSYYADIFDFALPWLRKRRSVCGSEAQAVTDVYMILLANHRDSHVERKFGFQRAHALSVRAGELMEQLLQSDSAQDRERALLEEDARLKGEGVNPGTTADLIVATLLADRLEHYCSGRTRRTSYLEGREGGLGPEVAGGPDRRIDVRDIEKTTEIGGVQ